MSEDVKPGYVVVLAQQLKDGASVTIQFNMGLHAEVTAWNTELDKLTAVLNRQEVRANLENVRKEMKAQKLVEEVITKDILSLEEQRALIESGNDPQRRNKVNTQQIAQNITNQKGALDKTQRSIQELEKILADMEQKAA